MSKKTQPFVNPQALYEQLFNNNGHMFDGRNPQGKSLDNLPESDPCSDCLEKFGLNYPFSNNDLPPFDRKYVKMKGGARFLSPRVEREIKEMNERIYSEELFLL